MSSRIQQFYLLLTRFSLVLFLATVVVLLIEALGLSLFSLNGFGVLMCASMFVYSFFAIGIIKRSIKNLATNLFFISAIASVIVYVFFVVVFTDFKIFEINETYSTQVQQAQDIRISTSEVELRSAFDATLNHFAGVVVYFVPNEGQIESIVPIGESSGETVALDANSGYESFLISIYKDSRLILSHQVELLNSNFHELPIGIQPDRDSQQSEYTVAINRLSGTNRLGIVLSRENEKLLLGKKYSLDPSGVLQNIPDAFVFLHHKYLVSIQWELQLVLAYFFLHFLILYSIPIREKTKLLLVTGIQLVLSVGLFAQELRTGSAPELLLHFSTINLIISIIYHQIFFKKEIRKFYRLFLTYFKSSYEFVSYKSVFGLFVLLAIISIGIFLRFYEITRPFPYTDEYTHLLAAQSIVENSSSETTSYARSYYLVTLPIIIAFNIFDHNLEIARAVMSAANLLALVPLFFIARKISSGAVIAFFAFFLTNPLLFGLGRTVREYASLPLVFYLTLFLVILVIENFDRIKNQAKILVALNHPSVLLPLAILGGISYFALFIDLLSTIKVVVIGLLPIGLYPAFTRFNARTILSISLLVAGLIYLFQTLFPYLNSIISFIPSYNPQAISLLVASNYNSFGSFGFIGLFLTLIFSAGYAYSSKSLAGKITLLTFLSHFYFITFHLEKYLNSRYFSFTQLFFVLVQAMAVLGLIKVISKLAKRNVSKIILPLVIIVLSARAILILPSHLNTSGYSQLTGVYHDAHADSYNFIEYELENSTALLGGNIVHFYKFHNPNSDRIIRRYYSFSDLEVELINSEVQHSETGALFIDFRTFYWSRFSSPEHILSKLSTYNRQWEYKVLDNYHVFVWESMPIEDYVPPISSAESGV